LVIYPKSYQDTRSAKHKIQVIICLFCCHARVLWTQLLHYFVLIRLSDFIVTKLNHSVFPHCSSTMSFYSKIFFKDSQLTKLHDRNENSLDHVTLNHSDMDGTACSSWLRLWRTNAILVGRINIQEFYSYCGGVGLGSRMRPPGGKMHSDVTQVVSLLRSVCSIPSPCNTALSNTCCPQV